MKVIELKNGELLAFENEKKAKDYISKHKEEIKETTDTYTIWKRW